MQGVDQKAAEMKWISIKIRRKDMNMNERGRDGDCFGVCFVYVYTLREMKGGCLCAPVRISTGTSWYSSSFSLRQAATRAVFVDIGSPYNFSPIASFSLSISLCEWLSL